MSSSGELGPCLPGDKSAIVPALGAVVIAVGTLLLALRLFVRLRVVEGGYGWDDTTIIISWVFGVTAFGISCAQIPYGFGKHVGCTTPERLSMNIELQYIAEVPLILSSLFSRISICIFLLRLFSINLIWRWSLYIIAFLTTITNIASATIILIQCEPRAKLWNPTLEGHCWAPHVQVDIGNYQGAMSAFLDIALSLLPIYFMWQIQLSTKLKAGICGLMSLGLLTAACVIARTIYLVGLKSEDVTWDAVNVIVWANLEIQIAIVVANIPPISALFMRRKRRQQRRPIKVYSEGDKRLVDSLGNPQRGESLGQHTSATSLGSARRQGTVTTAEAYEPSDEGVAMEQVEGGIRRKVEVMVSRVAKPGA